MQAKAERFEMRLDAEILERIDAWRAKQLDVPSKSEAIRRLIDIALGSDALPAKLSPGERIMLVMIGEIYERLDIKGEINPQLISECIFGGHSWALRSEYSGILHSDEDNPAVVEEVGNILDMWMLIEAIYNRYSKKEKQQIANECSSIGVSDRFLGFDGNLESEHFGVARFFVEGMKKYPWLEKRDLNSHSPMLVRYRSMLSVFRQVRNRLSTAAPQAAVILHILAAQDIQR